MLRLRPQPLHSTSRSRPKGGPQGRLLRLEARRADFYDWRPEGPTLTNGGPRGRVGRSPTKWRAKPAIWDGVMTLMGWGRAQPAPLMAGEARPLRPSPGVGAGAARHPIWRANPAIWGGVVTLTGWGRAQPVRLMGNSRPEGPTVLNRGPQGRLLR